MRRGKITDRAAVAVMLLTLVITVTVAALASDIIIGVAVGAAFFALRPDSPEHAADDDRHDSNR